MILYDGFDNAREEDQNNNQYVYHPSPFSSPPFPFALPFPLPSRLSPHSIPGPIEPGTNKKNNNLQTRIFPFGGCWRVVGVVSCLFRSFGSLAGWMREMDWMDGRNGLDGWDLFAGSGLPWSRGDRMGSRKKREREEERKRKNILFSARLAPACPRSSERIYLFALLRSALALAVLLLLYPSIHPSIQSRPVVVAVWPLPPKKEQSRDWFGAVTFARKEFREKSLFFLVGRWVDVRDARTVSSKRRSI